MHDEVGVLVEEVTVVDGNAGELADDLGRERPAEVGDEVGRALAGERVDELTRTRESTNGSSARIRGGLSTDARILRIFVWPGGFDSPSWSSSGVRVSSASGRERRLREALRVATDLDDVVVARDVEDAGHQLDDGGLVAQLRRGPRGRCRPASGSNGLYGTVMTSPADSEWVTGVAAACRASPWCRAR